METYFISLLETESGPLINLVNTPVLDETNFQLLTVSYVKVSTNF